MKSFVLRRPSSDCRLFSGFTLVELLVVISIIVIMLGIIVPTYRIGIDHHPKYTKAKVAVKNLETAFNCYLDYYHVWPSALADGLPHEIDNPLVSIMRGDQGPDNVDAIAFYEFESTNSAAGALDALSNPNNSATWQNYRVQVDKNYDKKITVGDQNLYRTVIVWSVGTNRSDSLAEPATKDGNVKSWD